MSLYFVLLALGLFFWALPVATVPNAPIVLRILAVVCFGVDVVLAILGVGYL